MIDLKNLLTEKVDFKDLITIYQVFLYDGNSINSHLM